VQIDFEKIRKEEFPATERCMYFNAAGHSLSPACVINAMKNFLDSALQDGLVEGMAPYGKIDSVREKIAKLIHARREEIALMRNTSDGLSTIANGIRFKEGENVIISDIEFPSIVYSLMNLQKKGLEVKIVKNVGGKILVDNIKRSIDSKTRAVVISSVSFLNGFKTELRQVGHLCREYGIFFVVDAMQQVGALDLDVKKCYIDMLACGCYKWLMVPDGVAILFVNKDVIEDLDVSKVGWWNVKNERAFFEIPGAHYDFTFKDDALRFMESHPAVPGIYGLDASLDLISKIGIENIEERILYLTNVLIQGLKEQGIEIVSPIESEYRSGIVVINPRDKEEAFNSLVNKNVRTSLRNNGIRISPHFYNNKEEITMLLKILENKKFRR